MGMLGLMVTVVTTFLCSALFQLQKKNKYTFCPEDLWFINGKPTTSQDLCHHDTVTSTAVTLGALKNTLLSKLGSKEKREKREEAAKLRIGGGAGGGGAARLFAVSLTSATRCQKSRHLDGGLGECGMDNFMTGMYNTATPS